MLKSAWSPCWIGFLNRCVYSVHLVRCIFSKGIFSLQCTWSCRRRLSMCGGGGCSSLNHARLSVTPRTAVRQASLPSPSPGTCSSSSPLSRWCHPIISSSVMSVSSFVAPFSSCPHSFLASESFLMSWFFESGGMVPTAVTLEKAGSRLEMQMVRPRPRTIGAEILGVLPAVCVLTVSPGDSVAATDVDFFHRIFPLEFYLPHLLHWCFSMLWNRRWGFGWRPHVSVKLW